MNKRGWTIWDVLIWVGIIMLLVWALLKSFGVIHSPVWVDMVPYYGIFAAAVGTVYKIGKIMKGIETTEQKVDKLLGLEKRFEEVEKTHKLCLDGELKYSPYHKK